MVQRGLRGGERLREGVEGEYVLGEEVRGGGVQAKRFVSIKTRLKSSLGLAGPRCDAVFNAKSKKIRNKKLRTRFHFQLILVQYVILCKIIFCCFQYQTKKYPKNKRIR